MRRADRTMGSATPDSEDLRVLAARTPAARAARGKAARAAVSRDAHAGFEPAAGRADPVTLLEQQAAGRVAELLPIRYGRMLASPFAFFRGAALLMATDLSAAPVTGFTVQACGDAHLSNFGIFASPERRLVFDVNDFDETLPAPWEWDIKRLAASIEVAGRDNGLSRAQRRNAVLAAAGRYRAAMRGLTGRPELGVWYAPAELDELSARYQAILERPERKLADADLARIRDRDGMHAIGRLVRSGQGRPRFVDEPPLVVPVADLPTGQVSGITRADLGQVLARYQRTLPSDRQHLLSQFQVADAARKVVGVGSVGMRCWIILLTGRDESDLLILQVKEAVPSVLAAASESAAGATGYASQGERVVQGQRLMQGATDIFLGWHQPEPDAAGGRQGSGDWYVRQLRDWKFSLTVESMGSRALRSYGELCGHALAGAHARSGDRIAIAAYLGGSAAFDRAVADFAASYADQNERDHAALAAAVASGRVIAETGV
jgi:Uncharacterized protein conserved in bacteria (DUF2252)